MNSTSKTALWQRQEGEKVRCLLCPHSCLLAPGEKGKCRARKHEPGRGLVSFNYGFVSSVALDPVEKKPLYHWRPGETILSLGTVGCSMDCPFCQNWVIACWEEDVALTPVRPGDVPRMALKNNVTSAAFTYNEPLVWYEFVLEASRALKEQGLAAVIVSNGQINPKPLEELAPFIAAANIDLKAYTEAAYKLMGGSLEAAKNAIKTLTGAGVHVETTFLLVPGINDDREAFKAMTGWLGSLKPQPVLHISRYFPSRSWTAPATPPPLLDEFAAVAGDRLSRVYLGNVGKESDTRCLSCGSILVSRKNYSVKIQGLDSRGQCTTCGAPSDIVMNQPENED
ncbi:MAG: AmmeMemoRadiSam system radical SAM enzyme [Synergistaceae bacterium]|nr:AmmeMemoRadiSam system radical SAM enzyme [Synergistaceae bacterium]